MEELVEQFDVHAPGGQLVRPYVYQEMIDAGTFQNPNATIPGLKRVETEDGDGVNYVDEQTYFRIATGETLKRV